MKYELYTVKQLFSWNPSGTNAAVRHSLNSQSRNVKSVSQVSRRGRPPMMSQYLMLCCWSTGSKLFFTRPKKLNLFENVNVSVRRNCDFRFFLISRSVNVACSVSWWWGSHHAVKWLKWLGGIYWIFFVFRWRFSSTGCLEVALFFHHSIVQYFNNY